MMFDDAVQAAVAEAIAAARRSGHMIVTVESCTGGLVCAALTALSGSSDAVHGGFITYSNAAKEQLGVPGAVLAEHGAVSEATARAMAEAALARVGPGAFAAVSVTGIAGPTGGTARKPVGLVHFGASVGRTTLHRETRFGDVGRAEVRRRSVLAALALATEALQSFDA